MSAFDFAIPRRTVSVAMLMTFAFASAQAQELPSAKLILDWAIQGHNSAITMGEEKGWYKEAGANVTVSRGYGSGDTVAKIATGAFQIGYGDIYVLLRFLGSNPGAADEVLLHGARAIGAFGCGAFQLARHQSAPTDRQAGGIAGGRREPPGVSAIRGQEQHEGKRHHLGQRDRRPCAKRCSCSARSTPCQAA